MALLTKQTDFSRFAELARCILLLSLSEEIGKDDDGNISLAESARVTIIHHIKGIEDISLDDKNNTEMKNAILKYKIVTLHRGRRIFFKNVVKW